MEMGDQLHTLAPFCPVRPPGPTGIGNILFPEFNKFIILSFISDIDLSVFKN
jgi:hypothetical protein